MPRWRFTDRTEGGRALAPRVVETTEPPSVVLGIPRGGVVTAAPVARALGAPLCAVWVEKLVAPREPDVVVGAVDLEGDATLAVETVRAAGLSDEEVAELAYHAHQRLVAAWERAPGLDATALLPGANAIIVDDCICSGLTVWAAMRWARKQGARTVSIAVPVADQRIWSHLSRHADQAIACVLVDDGPLVVSEVYERYASVGNDEIAGLLRNHPGNLSPPPVVPQP